jgi:hypothetical protein
VTDLLPLLEEFYADKLATLLSHQAGARLVRQYDFNNTYQYIINRDETHLTWLTSAILGLNGSVPPEPPEPERRVSGSGDAAAQTVFEQDAAAAQQFVDKWRPRVETMSNARHRGMLRVILGETLEQKRFFEQARAGQTDLLGRRPDHVGPRVGSVLPNRWIE